MARSVARRRASVAVLISYAMIGATSAFSQTREVVSRLTVNVGAATTDNLGRVPDAARESESFAITGVDIGVLRESAGARIYVDGAIDYYAYDSDEFDNETAGAIDAGLSLRAIPDRFSWDFNERVEHTRIDPFSPAAPGNRERINLFSTGPRLNVPLGDASTFGVVGQFADRHYRESESLDGPTRTITMRIARDLSELQRFGLVVAGRDMRFDDPTQVPYEIHEAYLNYERSTASEGSFSVSGGRTRLQRENESDSAPYFEMIWSRNITPRSSFSFSGGQRLESPADSFDVTSLEGPQAGGVGDTLLVADPRLTKNLRLAYTLTRARAVFRATREDVREKYDSDTIPDREFWRGSLGMDYRFTPVLRGDIELTTGRETFESTGEADERMGRASLFRRLGRSWEASLVFEYNRREDDLAASYKERRYILSLLWNPPR
jgi:hypothetical protein